MIQFTIAGIKYSDYPGIALEDLMYIKQFATYRIGSSMFSDDLKPAELLDLDQFSARMRAFVAFLTDRATLARIQLPADFQTQTQTILTNILKLKKDLVNMKPENIPILKADIYMFVASYARNNFIEEPEFKTSEIPVLNTSNLPIKKSSLQDIALAVKDTIAPAAKAPAVPTATPVAPLAPTMPRTAPASTGLKFSELVDMLLTYSPIRTTGKGQLQPQQQQLTSSATDLLNTQYAAAGTDGSSTMTSNAFFDQIRTVVRDELKGVKEGPKDAANKDLVDRATKALKNTAEATEKVSTNALEQGKWFRTAADGGSCPYAQSQQMAVGAEPVPVPPFNMDDYIRKDSIPCWACTLK